MPLLSLVPFGTEGERGSEDDGHDGDDDDDCEPLAFSTSNKRKGRRREGEGRKGVPRLRIAGGSRSADANSRPKTFTMYNSSRWRRLPTCDTTRALVTMTQCLRLSEGVYRYDYYSRVYLGYSDTVGTDRSYRFSKCSKLHFQISFEML